MAALSLAGRFETVVVDGEAMLAFPIGRHAELAAKPARVTVCVPVFNGGTSLTRCLQSITSQRYRDIDILVVDNGSTDTTIATACALANAHPRMVVYQNACNVGRVGNWNRCLELARGEFVKLVMVNDFLGADCVHALVDAMDANPGTVLARASLTILQRGGATQFVPLFEASCLLAGPEAIRYCVERGNIAAGPTAQLFRRSAITANDLRFDIGMSWAADYDFAVRLLESGDFAYVREPLFVFDETAQRHYASRNLVAELREELAIRLLAVGRNPALFRSMDRVIVRCAELCREQMEQTTDPGVRAELLDAFEFSRAALLQSVAAPARGVASEDDRSRYLQLPSSPAVDAGVARRVCIVSNGLIGPTRGGGVSRWVTQLAETLVGAGHDVTVLLARWYPPDDGTFAEWIEFYRRRGIALQVLECNPAVRFHGPLHILANREVYEWLKRSAPFDVVHFNDFEGMGHYTLLAKRQGLGFQETILCVTVHSPHLYLKQAMQQYVTRVTDMELDFVERRSVELADVLISPSQFMLDWMRSEKWILPAHCVVQQSLVPPAVHRRREMGNVPEPVTEVVFFGVLQELKGVTLFCDALEMYAAAPHPAISVTFLGKDGIIDDMSCRDYIARRCASWTLPVRVLTDLGPDDALAYLAGRGRLAVMASRLDNSPYVVMECLEHGIPFLASRVGGIPELIHTDDIDRVCYDRSPAVLASLLARVVREGALPARHRISREDRLQSWLGFYQTIPAHRGQRASPPTADPASLPLVTMCITHFNRAALLEQAVASVVAQDYPNLELVIVDDGSTDPAAIAYLAAVEARAAREQRPWRVVRQENRYLGAARNNGARHARGEFVAFLDDDDVAKPHRISTQVTAAMRTNADIVLSGMDEFTGMEPPVEGEPPVGTWISLGPCVSVGTLQNCFGAVHAMVRRSSFLALGGFREVVRVGHEDWEFWARAVHAGQRLEMVPEALNWYRLTPGSMLKTTSPYQNDMVSLQPHLDAVPAGMRPLVQMAFGTFRQHVVQEAARSRQRTEIARKVISGARLLASRHLDEAAVCLVEAVRDAMATQDTATCFDTLCDVGAMLAGTAVHRETGMALLVEAQRLAASVNYGRGLEVAEGLLQTMSAVDVRPIGAHAGSPTIRPTTIAASRAAAR